MSCLCTSEIGHVEIVSAELAKQVIVGVGVGLEGGRQLGVDVVLHIYVERFGEEVTRDVIGFGDGVDCLVLRKELAAVLDHLFSLLVGVRATEPELPDRYVQTYFLRPLGLHVTHVVEYECIGKDHTF